MLGQRGFYSGNRHSKSACHLYRWAGQLETAPTGTRNPTFVGLVMGSAVSAASCSSSAPQCFNLLPPHRDNPLCPRASVPEREERIASIAQNAPS
jgi:hypothetical protein